MIKDLDGDGNDELMIRNEEGQWLIFYEVKWGTFLCCGHFLFHEIVNSFMVNFAHIFYKIIRHFTIFHMDELMIRNEEGQWLIFYEVKWGTADLAGRFYLYTLGEKRYSIAEMLRDEQMLVYGDIYLNDSTHVDITKYKSNPQTYGTIPHSCAGIIFRLILSSNHFSPSCAVVIFCSTKFIIVKIVTII